jgi:uncharacterized membrane protein
MVSLILKALETRYENQLKTKESLESKAANLIAFVAIIVSIYTGFFSGILTKQTTFSLPSLLFWMSTIFYLLAAVSSLIVLWVRWGSVPLRITREFIEEHKKSSNERLEEIFQTDYLNAIEDLTKSNNRKAFWLRFGFSSAFLAILFTVFLITSLL